MTTNDPPTLRARDVSVRRGGTTILQAVQFELPAGLWALRGANGSGKSTLLRTVAGVLPMASGSLQISGHDLRRDAARARAQLGYVPQSAEFFGYLTVREFLQTVAAFRRTPVDEALALFEQLVHSAAVSARISTLSAGQRRKLLFAAAECGHPPVILLDEPTNALDHATVTWLEQALQRWRDQGRLVLVALHGTPLSVPFDGTLEVRDGGVLPLRAR